MSFDEVRLPLDVERGASGGLGFNTTVIELADGREVRNQNWQYDRGSWNISYGIRSASDAAAVIKFFAARRGRLRGFRFRDWSLYQTTGVEVFAEGDGFQTEFQLTFDYEDLGGFTYTKIINKPVSSEFEVYLDGTAQTTGFTLDDTTGVVTFDTAPGSGVDIGWSGAWDLPVRFDIDRINTNVLLADAMEHPSLDIIELKPTVNA